MAFDVFYFVDKHHLLNVLDHETVESMHQLVIHVIFSGKSGGNKKN